MQDARIIMLGATGTGAVLGALFAMSVSTTMKPGPEETWRTSLPKHSYSTESYRFVESGPIDAGPRRWLTPPIQEYEPLPDYTVPDYTEELGAVMAQADVVATADRSAERAAAEAADTSALAPYSEAPAPAAAQDTRTPEPAPETPSVQGQPAIVITLPDVPATTM